MSKATGEFTVLDPTNGKAIVFEEGDDVPDEIARNVGAHLLDEPAPRTTDVEAGGDFTSEDLEARLVAAVDEAIAAYRERERAAFTAILAGGADDEPFDPTADKVTAKQVHDYLHGIDVETVAGEWEHARVVEAEKAGENRSSALA